MKDLLRNKKLMTIIGVILAVVLVVVAGMLVFVKANAEVKNAKQEYAELQAQIDGVGGIVSVVAVANDVRGSKEIKDSDITYTSCTVAASNNLITDASDVVGKYLKTDLKAGEVISKSNISEFVIEDDLRYLDIITDENPIGLEVGDYVDVTIDFPFGQHYIAMTHKQVVGINSGIIKIIVDKNDIYIYESMKVDKATYKGTVIKSIEYIEAGTQQAADRKYPLNANTLNVAVMDPTFTINVDASVMAERKSLDNLLKATLTEEMAKAMEKEKGNLTKYINEAQKELEKRLEKEAKDRARNK